MLVNLTTGRKVWHSRSYEARSKTIIFESILITFEEAWIVAKNGCNLKLMHHNQIKFIQIRMYV